MSERDHRRTIGLCLCLVLGASAVVLPTQSGAEAAQSESSGQVSFTYDLQNGSSGFLIHNTLEVRADPPRLSPGQAVTVTALRRMRFEMENPAARIRFEDKDPFGGLKSFALVAADSTVSAYDTARETPLASAAAQLQSREVVDPFTLESTWQASVTIPATTPIRGLERDLSRLSVVAVMEETQPFGFVPTRDGQLIGSWPAVDVQLAGRSSRGRGGARGQAGTEPRPTDKELAEACRDRSNRGPPLTSVSTVRVYLGLRKTICIEAKRFEISEVLLATLLQHEGYNRSKLIRSRFRKTIERSRLGGSTVGVGQMRPDLARRLARDHFARYEEITVTEAKDKLIQDTPFAVRMAAARLSELKEKYDLSDREAFIVYAFGDEDMPELRRTKFKGDKARPRVEQYEEVKEQIERSDEY